MLPKKLLRRYLKQRGKIRTYVSTDGGGLMALTEEEVLQILKLVEQSSFDELHLEAGGLKLLVRKKGCGAAVIETDPAAATPAMPHAVPGSERVPHVVESAPAKSTKTEAAAQPEGMVPIIAPMLGMFYRRPAPESPPYVEVGSHVKEDDTVCLIEVMKVFTAVKAGVRGRITEVLIDENTMVEYGQPLFMVKPDA
jgi:acetyl-CoA carboxylase biotin carboxyl carrier protein